MRLFRSSAILALLLLATMPAQAAPTDTPPAAATPDPLAPTGPPNPEMFRRQADEINRVPKPDGEALGRAVSGAVAVDARQRKRCLPGNITLGQLEPVTLDGMIAGMIAAGQLQNAWFVSVTAQDCPSADPIRVLLFRASDGRLSAVFAGQGESLAWPTLSRGALGGLVNAAVERMRREDPACAPNDMTPTGVRVAERSADLGPNFYGIRLSGSWKEVWLFEPCGHKIGIPVTFLTDGKGGGGWDIDRPGIVYVK